MTKEIYVCDHCGKELDEKVDHIDFDILEYDYLPPVDLCIDCYEELKRKIKNFCGLE